MKLLNIKMKIMFFIKHYILLYNSNLQLALSKIKNQQNVLLK